MTTTYVQRSTASDLSAPGEYDLQLLEGAAALVDRLIVLAASQTKEGYHYTEPGVPGVVGGVGNYTVAVDIAAGDTNVQISAAVARVNSLGVVQQQTAFSAEQTAAGAVLNFSFTNVNLGTWVAGDRLRAAVRYRNSHTHTARDVTVSFNTVDCQVVAPWSAAMAFRLRARLRFSAGSGMAQWCFDQNATRLGQAYHLNPGTVNEERSHHEVVDDVYICDLIFPELALAQDTWNTITDASVLAWLRPDDMSRPASRSSADMHQCVHETPGVPDPARGWVWP